MRHDPHAPSRVDGVPLGWARNIEADVVGYRIYRALSPDGAFIILNTFQILVAQRSRELALLELHHGVPAAGGNLDAFRVGLVITSLVQIGSGLGGSQNWGVPAGFDAEGFVAAARRNFLTLQDAWDRSDIATLRSMITSGGVLRFVTTICDVFPSLSAS